MSEGAPVPGTSTSRRITFLLLFLLICALPVALLAIQHYSTTKQLGIGIIGGPLTLHEMLDAAKAVINGTVNSSTVSVSAGSSFSVLVTLTYLEGRFSDHGPITLILSANQSDLVIAVTNNESGTMKQITLNNLMTWDKAGATLEPNQSISATMTVCIPPDFPRMTVYLSPLFGYTPRHLVWESLPSIKMTVH